MTSTIYFFCTPDEERSVWEFVSKDDVASLLIDPFDMNSVTPVNFEILPAWPEPLVLFFHHCPSGSINWHRSMPVLQDTTHSALVNSLLARNKWKELNLSQGSSMLDIETSPLLIYYRGMARNGQVGPCELSCPPSNPAQISDEYRRWIERSKNWIRRKAALVHNWKHPSTMLPNPCLILSSLYAFPKANEEIATIAGKYAILLR